MKAIYWFKLETTDRQVIRMERGAKILTAMNREGWVTLYAEVEVNAPKENRFFHIVGTGRPIPDGKLTYLGTVWQPPFYWHAYEETP